MPKSVRWVQVDDKSNHRVIMKDFLLEWVDNPNSTRHGRRRRQAWSREQLMWWNWRELLTRTEGKGSCLLLTLFKRDNITDGRSTDTSSIASSRHHPGFNKCCCCILDCQSLILSVFRGIKYTISSDFTMYIIFIPPILA